MKHKTLIIAAATLATAALIATLAYRNRQARLAQAQLQAQLDAVKENNRGIDLGFDLSISKSAVQPVISLFSKFL